MKKLLITTFIVMLLSSLSLMSLANAGLITYTVNGDTYANSTTPTGNGTNYGTQTYLYVYFKTSTNHDTGFMWLNASNLFGNYSSSNILTTFLKVTPMSGVGAGATGTVNSYYCNGTLSYANQSETTLTWANRTTICSAWSIFGGTREMSSYVINTSYYINISSYVNASNLANIIELEDGLVGSLNNMSQFYTKEYAGNSSYLPSIASHIIAAGDLYIYPKAYDELTLGALGGNLTYNVTFTNGTNTISFTKQDGWGENSTTWSTINNNTLTGPVTATVIDYNGTYYQNNYYQTISSSSNGVAYTPYLINKTSANINAPSIYFVNGAGAPVSGVTVTVYKQINGVWTIVRQGLTDATGVVQFYLYNNAQYMINGVYGSYSTSNNTITPSQASYSMVLSMGGVSYQKTMFNDIQYAISPLTLTIPSSTTNQTVTFNVYAPNSNLNYINIVVRNNNNTLLANTTSTTPSGAQLQASFNDSGATLIKVNYTISKVGYGPFTMSYNYAVSSVGSGNYSLTSFLTLFGADTSIPDIWKQVISIMVTIAIMGFVIRLSSDLNIGSIIGCIMLTFFGVLSWFPWLIIILIWLIVVGIIIMGRGL